MTVSIPAQPVQMIKVKVVAPFRVVHQGVAYTGEQFDLDENKNPVKVKDADVIEVPNDDEHRAWLKVRWVELVNEKEK